MRGLIRYEEAVGLILDMARSFGTEEVGLGEAYGRVLAEVVYADRDYPPFNRATMDGYALRRSELLEGRRVWRVRATIFAGDDASGGLEVGECYKIMTGAAVPVDADMVIRREDVVESDGMVELGGDVVGNALNIARKGEDLSRGDLVIHSGALCDPSVIGLLASTGKGRLLVQRRPRVRILTTGNEVVSVEGAVRAVEIRNSNRWVLESMLAKWGIGDVVSVHVADEPGLLAAAVREAMDGDILICTGGVSAGDADHMPGVLEEAGVSCLFHKMAIKPGKPVWSGVMPKGGMVFALPGNPFSCMVGFVLLVEPYLRICWGMGVRDAVSLPLAGRRVKRTALDEFFPVRLVGEPVVLEALALNGSGDIRLGMQADALAIHPAGRGDLEAGALVRYLTVRSPW